MVSGGWTLGGRNGLETGRAAKAKLVRLSLSVIGLSSVIQFNVDCFKQSAVRATLVEATRPNNAGLRDPKVPFKASVFPS